MRRRSPTPAYPGWGPISPPTHPRLGRGGDLRRQLIVPALLFTAALFGGLLRTRGGLFAFALSVILWFVLQNRPDKGWTILEWVAVVVLVVLLSNAGITAPKVRTTVDRKAPTERVEAARGDFDRFRRGAANLWEQINPGLPNLTDKPEPKPKKGHH